MLNKIIFKRFFIRKNQDSSIDWSLPVIFVTIVALSTGLIFFSSIQLNNFQKEKDAYLAQKSNHMYNLYIGDTDYSQDSSEFNDYRDLLESNKKMSFYKGFDRFPDMIRIRSHKKIKSRVQTYLFGKSDKKLLNVLTPDGNPPTENVIYLNSEVMRDLEVKENDFVLVSESTSNVWMVPLRVKQIKEKMRMKSYIFDNYLARDKNISRRVRFNFSNPLDAFQFISYLDKEIKIPTPYYLGKYVYDDGYENGVNFLRIYSESDKNRKISIGATKERYLQSSSLPSNNFWGKENFLNDTVEMIYLSGADSIAFKFDISLNAYKEFPYDSLKSFLYYTASREDYDIYKNLKLSEVKLFNNYAPDSFYVEFDFRRNLFSHGQSENTIEKKQIQILSDLNNNIYSSDMYYSGKTEQRGDAQYYFVYYHTFENEFDNIEIMNELDKFNVRWDNARWKTIIDLNKSLDEGRKNLMALILANLIVFVLILSIKFLLRLKLELHSIGVLKCFGYSKQIIYFTYNSGNLIMIIVGFLIGVFPMGIMISSYFNYSFTNLVDFYSSEYFMYCIWFLVVSIIASVITTSYFLRLYTEKDNIYELIKYEG